MHSCPYTTGAGKPIWRDYKAVLVAMREMEMDGWIGRTREKTGKRSNRQGKGGTDRKTNRKETKGNAQRKRVGAAQTKTNKTRASEVNASDRNDRKAQRNKGKRRRRRRRKREKNEIQLT